MFYCNRVVVQAPGKVNLSLDITGATDDGMHTLDTVMHAIDLSDIVVVGRRPERDIRVTCSRPDVPEDDTNIAHRAAIAFFGRTGLPVQGVSIHIDKSIPMQAGLAGGSADAAAVLRGLDRLFETGLSEEQLREIGGTVGADVPFCIAGGCRLARGKGELLEELPVLSGCLFAIAKPPRGMSTRYAFSLYDQLEQEPGRPDTASMTKAIRAGDLAAIGGSMFNVFEQVTGIPEVEMLKGIMLVDGAVGAVMSGSGSAVAGLFSDERAAKKCLRHLRDAVEEAFLAKPLPHGAKMIHAS